LTPTKETAGKGEMKNLNVANASMRYHQLKGGGRGQPLGTRGSGHPEKVKIKHI